MYAKLEVSSRKVEVGWLDHTKNATLEYNSAKGRVHQGVLKVEGSTCNITMTEEGHVPIHFKKEPQLEHRTSEGGRGEGEYRSSRV